MIGPLVVALCVLAVYAVFVTVVAWMHRVELDMLEKTIESLGQSYRDADRQASESGNEVNQLNDRIAELEAGANDAIKPLLKCFEVRRDD